MAEELMRKLLSNGAIELTAMLGKFDQIKSCVILDKKRTSVQLVMQ